MIVFVVTKTPMSQLQVMKKERINEASVTEWSKVLRSGRSVFARVGSSPTACIFSSAFYCIDDAVHPELPRGFVL